MTSCNICFFALAPKEKQRAISRINAPRPCEVTIAKSFILANTFTPARERPYEIVNYDNGLSILFPSDFNRYRIRAITVAKIKKKNDARVARA